jgi:cytochrome c-type biogenesis protein CcmH
MRKLFLIIVLIFTLLPMQVSLAVEPSEILDDPILEQRARAISKDLRCLVCQNEDIDHSNASLAADLRVLVRERLVAGDSDKQVVTYVVDRYGDYVLLKPKVNLQTILLWGAMPIIFLSGIALLILAVRKGKKDRQNKKPNQKLSKEEKAVLAALEKSEG